MADRLFKSVAAEGKGITSWDVENILTKAVYRALNVNNHFAHVLGQHAPVNVDKNLTSADPHHQLRLVAEKLCARVERRYEKRLLQQREQDRADIDRKLADIRAEYSEQMEMRRRDLERKRVRLEEQFAQKDRALRHKLELELSEKESALEITRKSLETRLTELTLSKEHLDRVKVEFQAKFAADVELLNREWERVSGRKEELRAFYRQEFENEQQELLERSIELEKENVNLKKKVVDYETELSKMRSQLAILGNLQEDLKIANERIRKEVAENYRLSRCNYEAGRLREENAHLKEDIEQLRSLTAVVNVGSPVKDVRKSSEELQSTKINELKMIIKMMGDKVNSLTSERDYLRDVLRFSHKDIYRIASRVRKTDANRSSSNKISHQNFRNSTEDSSVSSTLSGCGSDLQKIRKRFSVLDELAKTLDTTVECVNAAHSFSQDHFNTSSVRHLVNGYESSDAEITDYGPSISKVGKTVVEELPYVRVTNKVTSGAPDLRTRRQDIDIMPQRRTESADLYKSVNSKTFSSHAPSKDMDESTPAVVSSTVSGIDASFSEKLKAHNELNRKLKFSLASTEEEKSKDNRVTTSNHESSTADELMTLVVNDQESDKQGHKDSEHLLNGDDGSQMMELDEVQVDKDLDSDGEIEW